jgi:hypothetical protein
MENTDKKINVALADGDICAHESAMRNGEAVVVPVF